MLARTRTRERTETFGAVYSVNESGKYTQTGGPFDALTYRKEIQDFYLKARRFDGTLPPSDLVIRELVHEPASVTMYQYWFGKLDTVFSAVPMALQSPWADSPPGGWTAIEKSDTEYVAMLLARSNPYSYTVSIPIMISELVEAGSLLGVLGVNALATGGKSYLTNEFGIEPLMADIKALHKITKSIENKIKDLNSLRRRGGLRAKVYLGKKSISDARIRSSSWSTFGKSFYTDRAYTYTSKVWGTCRWRPGPFSQINLDKLVSVNNAMRIVFDLKTPDWSTIWEMIPFSWLVDYFLNVGDVLQAAEQSDLVEPYDICIMRTRTIKSDIKVVRPAPSFFDERPDLPRQRSLVMVPGKIVYTEKRRRANIPTPANFSSLLAYGFMSRSQAENLTALLLAFNKRRF